MWWSLLDYFIKLQPTLTKNQPRILQLIIGLFFLINFRENNSKSMASNITKIAVVTGGNKGIGYAICERLSEQPNIHVLLTARNEELGKAAVLKLGRPNVEYHQLDITNKDSVKRLANYLHQTYQGLDILVNNAGMAFRGPAFDGHIAETTINTNYFGTANVCEELMPLVREEGRVVMVSSSAGLPSIIKKQELREKFTNPEVTIDELHGLMRKFVQDVKDGTYKEEGWPSTAYGMSKVGMTAYTRALAAISTYKNKHILINASCPGYVRTDMTSQSAQLTPYQGAETPTMLALSSHTEVTGGFWRQKKQLDWEHM